jgi:hypothetical protein
MDGENNSPVAQSIAQAARQAASQGDDIVAAEIASFELLNDTVNSRADGAIESAVDSLSLRCESNSKS